MGILRADILTHSQLESAGGSVDFDGSGDYLTIPNHTAFHFTGDYTIDFYIKFTTNSGTQRIFGQRNSNASDISVLGEFASNNFYYYYSTNGSATENMIIGTYGTNIELNTWHHVAIVSDGGVHHAYLDGVLTAVNANNPTPLNDGDSTWSIGRQGAYTANEFSGSIYGFRITHKALYKTNFTLSKFKPKVLPETVLLCCVSSTSVTEAEVSAAGDITSNGDPQVSSDTPLLKEDITDTGVVFDGFGNFATSTYMVPPKGKTTQRNRGRALMPLGARSPFSSILGLDIQSEGISQDFGDLRQEAQLPGTASSSTRMLVTMGYTAPASTNTIDFITIANIASSTDFGDLTEARRRTQSLSNSTRAVHVGGTGASPTPYFNTMDFNTIATLGNSTDFGDTNAASAAHGGSVASSTRGIYNPALVNSSYVNSLEFITIATTGNGQDFGDLSLAKGYYFRGSICDTTRGLFAGGYNPVQDTIEFVTMATLGDSTDFGDLTVARRGGGGTSNSIKSVFMGGYLPGVGNVIDSVIIQTTGNAKDFGDLLIRTHDTSASSDSHGGL